MTTALLILAAYALALAVIFYGQWRGWFDPWRVSRIVSQTEFALGNGATITVSGGHFMRSGDRIVLSIPTNGEVVWRGTFSHR